MRKRMESFLLGDTGPDVFYEVQEMVVQTLQEKYYSSFVVSEQYKKLQESMSDEKLDGKKSYCLNIIKQCNAEILKIFFATKSNL